MCPEGNHDDEFVSPGIHEGVTAFDHSFESLDGRKRASGNGLNVGDECLEQGFHQTLQKLVFAREVVVDNALIQSGSGCNGVGRGAGDAFLDDTLEGRMKDLSFIAFEMVRESSGDIGRGLVG